MFRRNKDDSESQTPAGQTDADAPPLKPFSKGGSHIPSKPPSKTPTLATGSSSQRPSDSPTPQVRNEPARHGDLDSKKLTVGRDICLSGEITSCERLVVEGRVEASLSDARFIDIAPTGFFKGNADVREADVSGRFEGQLVASERLTVRAGGRISGSVRYGSIVIEPGGQVTGDMQPLDAALPKSPVETD